MTKRTEREEDDTVRYATLACARDGKALNRIFNVVNPHLTGKTECKARFNALKSDGKLQLTTIHNIHNHDRSPKKSHFFRYNREVSDAIKRVLNTNDMAGVRMNKSFGSLVVGADDDGRLKNVFWVDPRSRAAYQYFGDVVTFDTTYLTNRYGMPFAPFVGVNHHGQSILLGAGLISSEDTKIFVWLFQTWLQCIDGIAPKTIITDQDRAMKNVIGIVFSNTRHRFCLWHILNEVPEKLSSYSSYKTGMKNALMKYVYDSQSVDEFETSWVELITMYNLQENMWLQSLYADREYWVLAFL
ncbi:protein FAR1-RELATED SEQUENCE 4-like [Juglans microcarpa x Juglans regia]|uniref:protein FAR1-RELATED SEQUENCE 4-like n=1 Tax=Juglans microcarpa x Juglans regia TaxID=2249226 RepID=UPI001B7EB805|nr:protein FAR1-RELATED SEQUENCE 4-like [Juglans microcarpa x Juglans regia]